MTTLGQRCVEVTLAEHKAGVCEEPPGSNTGIRIREYLKPCVRGDSSIRLGLTASNWCAALTSWSLYQALRSTDKGAPHGYRASVVEMVSDVMDPNKHWTGTWVPISDVRRGWWVPKPGDLAVYDRSLIGRTDTAWWRHVNRIISYDVLGGGFLTVGGNELHRIYVTKQRLDNIKLLGFIAYPQDSKVASKPLLSAEEKKQINNLVFLTIDGMMRDSLYEGKTCADEEELDK